MKIKPPPFSKKVGMKFISPPFSTAVWEGVISACLVPRIIWDYISFTTRKYQSPMKWQNGLKWTKW